MRAGRGDGVGETFFVDLIDGVGVVVDTAVVSIGVSVVMSGLMAGVGTTGGVVDTTSNAAISFTTFS